MHAPCGTQVLFLAFLILCSAPKIFAFLSMFASASLFNCLQLILHQAPRSAWGATFVYDMSTHKLFFWQKLILMATPIFHVSAPRWWFGNIYMSACYIMCLRQPDLWHTAPPPHNTFLSFLLPILSSNLASATFFCFCLCQSELRCAIYIAHKIPRA